MIDEHESSDETPGSEGSTPISKAGRIEIAKQTKNTGPNTQNSGSRFRIKERFANWRKEREAKWKDTPIHDRTNVNLTRVIAASTVLYTLFAGWTLYEIHSGSTDTHTLAVAAGKQADHTQAIAGAAGDISRASDSFSKSVATIQSQTEKAVSELKRAADDSEKAMKIASESARKALDATIEAARLEERPWLAAHDGGIVNFSNESFKAKVVLWNTGKTPALRAKVCKQLVPSIVDLDGPVDYEFRGAVCDDIGALPPQTPLTLTITDDPAHNIGAIYSEITGGKNFLFIWGQVIYFEPMPRPLTPATAKELRMHGTRFCFEYDRFVKQFGLCREADANTMN
jgi:hypothetical protein